MNPFQHWSVSASACFLFLVLPDATAGAAKFATPLAYIQSIPGASEEVSARGDLNGDGREDVVLSVALSAGDEDIQRQLIVLLRDADGHMIVAAASGKDDIQPSNGTSRTEFDLWIDKGSLYVSNKNFWRGCGYRRQYQFRLQGVQFRLIGATRTDGSYEGDDARIVENDVNLITGVEVLTVTGGIKKRRKAAPISLFLKDFPLTEKRLFRLAYNGSTEPC